MEIGHKVGRWTTIGPAVREPYGNNGQKRTTRLCRCECGTEKKVYESHLKDEKTHSCGCITKEVTASRSTRHGETKTRLYQIYAGMKSRCLNPNVKGFDNYGGRGIKVCAAWLKSYETFRDWARNNGYAEHLTIERKNVNGDYDPSNCEWVTKQAQSRNRRDSRLLTAYGETKTLAEWLEDERCRVSSTSLYARLREGMDAENAMSMPDRRGRKGVANWGESRPTERCSTSAEGDSRIESVNSLLVGVENPRTIVIKVGAEEIVISWEEWSWITYQTQIAITDKQASVSVSLARKVSNGRDYKPFKSRK